MFTNLFDNLQFAFKFLQYFAIFDIKFPYDKRILTCLNNLPQTILQGSTIFETFLFLRKTNVFNKGKI